MIYLDNHATTAVDPRVVEAMAPCWTEAYGNSGSIGHAFGEEAARRVEQARTLIAESLGVGPREVVFTSGATESNNLGIFGITDRAASPGHLVTLATEHKAVLDPIDRLARRGWKRTFADVACCQQTNAGLVDVSSFAESLTSETVLASVMLANNEIGVLQPIRELADLCHQKDVLLHCDATQAVGKIPLDLRELGADLISFSAHKIYGPKGVGVLVVRNRSPRIRLNPQIVGGGQERGRRSGTLNVPGIVGVAEALRLCIEELSHEQQRLARLRDDLATRLVTALPETIVNGPPLDNEIRLAGNLNCSFPGVDGEALMMNMPEIAVSSGSACTSANPEPSHVLRALGVSEEHSRASLRFGLGRFTTSDEIEAAASTVVKAVERLRRLNA